MCFYIFSNFPIAFVCHFHNNQRTTTQSVYFEYRIVAFILGTDADIGNIFVHHHHPEHHPPLLIQNWTFYPRPQWYLPIVIAFAISGIALQVCEPLSPLQYIRRTSGGLGRPMDMHIFNKQNHGKNVDDVHRKTQEGWGRHMSSNLPHSIVGMDVMQPACVPEGWPGRVFSPVALCQTRCQLLGGRFVG